MSNPLRFLDGAAVVILTQRSPRQNHLAQTAPNTPGGARTNKCSRISLPRCAVCAGVRLCVSTAAMPQTAPKAAPQVDAAIGHLTIDAQSLLHLRYACNVRRWRSRRRPHSPTELYAMAVGGGACDAGIAIATGCACVGSHETVVSEFIQ